MNSLVRTALQKEVSAHQTKKRRGNHFQFIFLLFFPFTFSFSAGEVMIAVFPLELCHHSRSNSLQFTHYLHSSIHSSCSFTCNNFTHSSLFSLSICVFLSNSLNREKGRVLADASRTLLIFFPLILFASSLFYALSLSFHLPLSSCFFSS